MVIKPRFQLAQPFSEGLAGVSVCTDRGWRWGFIDESGEFVIKPRFHDSKSFREGLAGVQLGDKWGFINKRGKMIVDPKLDDEYGVDFEYREGLSAVKINKKYGYIDPAGKLVIPADFDHADNFSEGLAYVMIDDKAGFYRSHRDGRDSA